MTWTFTICLGILLAVGWGQFSVWLLNRVCRLCRETLAQTRCDPQACHADPVAEQLKTMVATRRGREAFWAAQCTQSYCSSDEYTRARFLRIQAEIALLRHEAMPKTWTEACRDAAR